MSRDVNFCFGDFKFITYVKPNGTSNEYIRMIQELMNGACNAVFSEHSSKKIIVVQKEGNEMQISQRMEHFDWLINDRKYIRTNLLA